MTSFGSAKIVNRDGQLVVEHADDVIGISLKLLAESGWFSIGDDGLLWLAGDYRYRYRPLRFGSTLDESRADRLADLMTPRFGMKWLVCERVFNPHRMWDSPYGQFAADREVRP